MQTAVGWLFGLKSKPGTCLSCSNVTIREMSDLEKQRILNSSQDFFAKDQAIWLNCIKGFPLVFERRVPDQFSVGDLDPVAVLLSLLAPGEIRTPILWVIGERGGGGGSSSSHVIELFYRFINNQLHTVDFNEIQESARTMFEKLGSVIASPYQHLDTALLNRLLECKRHPLTADAAPADIVARAADVCICLESLYSEGRTEIQFKLAISIACLLETNPLKREVTMKAVTDTYDLRSATVHGQDASHKQVMKSVESVLRADRLLRRSVLTRLLNNLDETTWKAAFVQARLGFPMQLDTAEWVAI
jgi:hypothetical protein